MNKLPLKITTIFLTNKDLKKTPLKIRTKLVII